MIICLPRDWGAEAWLANGARAESLVGNAHKKYELDMLFVFRIPSVKGLTVLLLKQVWTYSHRAGPGPLVGFNSKIRFLRKIECT